MAPNIKPDRISLLSRAAMTIIGTMAMRVAAEMAHHSSPRWLFLAGDEDRKGLPFGIGQEEREEELVPDEGQGDHEGRGQTGRRHRHDDPEEDPPGRHVVDHRRLLHLDRRAAKKSRISQTTMGMENAT